MERQEAEDLVLRALHGLPMNQQEVIRLKFLDGLSYREISQTTNLSESNVGFLIHTGMRKLHKDSRPPAKGQVL